MICNLEKRYIALMPDEEAIVDNVLSNTMNNEVIIENFGIKINRSILRRLNATFAINTDLWLNDEVSFIDWNYRVICLLVSYSYSYFR